MAWCVAGSDPAQTCHMHSLSSERESGSTAAQAAAGRASGLLARQEGGGVSAESGSLASSPVCALCSQARSCRQEPLRKAGEAIHQQGDLESLIKQEAGSACSALWYLRASKQTRAGGVLYQPALMGPGPGPPWLRLGRQMEATAVSSRGVAQGPDLRQHLLC